MPPRFPGTKVVSAMPPGFPKMVSSMGCLPHHVFPTQRRFPQARRPSPRRDINLGGSMVVLGRCEWWSSQSVRWFVSTGFVLGITSCVCNFQSQNEFTHTFSRHKSGLSNVCQQCLLRFLVPKMVSSMFSMVDDIVGLLISTFRSTHPFTVF